VAQVGHVASNSGSGTGATIATTWGTPTTAGNCGIAFLAWKDNDRDVDQQIDNPPAGWRLHRVIECGNGDPGTTGYIFVRPNLGAAEAAPSFVRSAGSEDFVWSIHEYENVDLGTPIRTASFEEKAIDPAGSGSGQQTQRNESLCIVGWFFGDTQTGGSFSDGTFTQRASVSAGSTGTASGRGLVVYDKEFGSQPAPGTGAPTWTRTATNDDYVSFNLILQPARAAVTADIKTWAARITAPTTPQLVNYTTPGFDVKAIRIWSVRQPVLTLGINSEFSLGFAADDGVTAKKQCVVGFWHAEGVTTERGWSDDEHCIKHYNTGTTALGSNEWEADFASIANGFSLDWTKVGGSENYWHVECFGGADYEATIGIGDMGAAASEVTGLPWRPNMVDVASQCEDALTTPQIRSNSMLSFGWCTESGETACYCQDYDPDENFVFRNLSFTAQVNDGALSYEAQMRQMQSDGFAWHNISGSTSDEFFFLAHNFGGCASGGPAGDRKGFNTGEYRFQIDNFRLDSGTGGETQGMPPFDDGGYKKTIAAMTHTEPNTRESLSNACGSFGYGRFDVTDGSVDAENVASFGTQDRTTSERKVTNGRFFYGATDGDMGSATNRRASSFADFDTITHDDNTGTEILITLRTMGPAGDGIVCDDDTLLVFFGPNH
jgi:hypothetical protein